MTNLKAWWNDDAKAISLTTSLKLDYAAVTLAWVWALWVVTFAAMFVYHEPDYFVMGIVISIMIPVIVIFPLHIEINTRHEASWNDDGWSRDGK